MRNLGVVTVLLGSQRSSELREMLRGRQCGERARYDVELSTAVVVDAGGEFERDYTGGAESCAHVAEYMCK
jgi:hypothetical protein